MALIKCPECGREISDKAQCCIHCGAPIEKNTESKVILRTAKTPRMPLGCSYAIYINGVEKTRLKHGESIDIKISAPVTIQAKAAGYLGSKLSQPITVNPGKVTKVSVKAVQNVFSVSVCVEVVDYYVDSSDF